MPLARLAGAALLLGALSSPAFAHAFLKKADPAVGATLLKAPPRLVLHYTEGVEPAFSSVEVLDAHGKRVDAGDLHTAPGDATTLIEGLKPLGAGTYTVEWHATSVDTHKTEGKFSFSVSP